MSDVHSAVTDIADLQRDVREERTRRKLTELNENCYYLIINVKIRIRAEELRLSWGNVTDGDEGLPFICNRVITNDTIDNVLIDLSVTHSFFIMLTN